MELQKWRGCRFRTLFLSKLLNKIARRSAHAIFTSTAQRIYTLTPVCLFVSQKLCLTFAWRLAQNENVALIAMVMNAETALCRLLPDGYVMSNSTSWGTLCFEWSQQKQKVVVRLSTTPWKKLFIIQLYIIRMLQLSVPIRLVFFHANQFDSTTTC